ncbi:M23 family metallopeptidase [Thalassobaculum sp.]|uniref:M23 family metallopeptidase n=1 Tax=Thalassobaculum sp. TaxID=2022740 RepID=UPI0032EF1E0B
MRAFIVLAFLGALASFGYGFWLVLSPEGHNWHVDIPLDRDIDRPSDRNRDGGTSADVGVPANPPAETTSDASPQEAPQVAPQVAPTAAPIALGLPIDCKPGVDCWIVNYVDVDPSDKRRDYRCGQMSYDGHKGTDIGLANEALIETDVPVLAAVAGRVIGTRDGEPDAGAAGIEAAKAAGRECGNGVRIEHGDGWVTQYCHLREGSLRVQAGQEVAAGQALGAVGLSGMTEFPHVHLSLSRDGQVVDPFRGVAGGPECGLGTQPLWDGPTLAALAAQRAPVLLDAAFFDGVPEADSAAAGTAARTELAPDAEAIVLWFRAAGVEPGDTGRVTITAPDGTVVIDETATFDRHQASVYRAFGLRNSPRRFPDGLPSGDWRGRVETQRDGRTTGERSIFVRVDG